MLIDKNLLFVDTLTTTTSGAATDYIDSTTVSIKNNDANKQPVWVVKTEGTAFAGGAACTATFQLQTSEASDFSGATTVTLAQSAAFLTAALTANTVMVKMRVPYGVKRYLRSYMVVGGTGVFSASSYSSFLVMDVPNALP